MAEANKPEPDTLVLDPSAGSFDTLFIHTSVTWMIIGAMPDWLACDKLSGTGSGYVVFHTLKPNPAAWNIYASFYLYSNFATTASFTIAQKEKTFGINEERDNFLKIVLDPSTGLIGLKSQLVMESVTIFDVNGKKILACKEDRNEMILHLPETCKGVFVLRIKGKTWQTERKILQY